MVRKAFEDKGLKLENFSAQLDFAKKVKDKIEQRNKVNTNLSVLDQQINEQKKANELARLKTEQNKIISEGITPELLRQKWLEKWDGKLPTTITSGELSLILGKQ